MIKIQVSGSNKDKPLISPTQMWNAGEGKVFQQYHNSKPTKDYYVNIGLNEPLIHIWWNNDERKYCLSSNTMKSLAEYVDTIMVKEIDATINIGLTINA